MSHLKTDQALAELERTLRVTCERLSPSELSPHRFFVAWHGVITLMFRALPPPLSTLKRELLALEGVFIPESSGSLWPKLTLAALQPQRRLSSADVDRLLEVCEGFNERLERALPVRVSSVSIVHYTQQSLERIEQSRSFSFKNIRTEERWRDISPPLQLEVSSLLATRDPMITESERAKVMMEGRSIRHYRHPQEGWSLIVELPFVYQELITALSLEIERRLPQSYEWLSPQSRHLTLRALN